MKGMIQLMFTAVPVLLIVESLEELADLVVPLFADVMNKNVEVPEWLDHPYGPDQVQVCITLTGCYLSHPMTDYFHSDFLTMF